jgi:predicted acyl esterase
VTFERRESDPVFRDRQPNKCYTTSNSDAPPGIVQYEDEVKQTFTLMGTPLVRLTYETSATDYWIAARLFDKKPNGEMTLVTRGICRVNTEAAPDVDCARFELWGNAWTFEKGNTILLELSQADSPMFRLNNNFSTIAYSEAALELPSAPPSNRRDFRDS